MIRIDSIVLARKYYIFATASIVLGMQVLCGADAQEINPNPSSTAGANQLEEVTVTAERKEENLQHVPLAVSAFTASDLQDLQIQSTLDVAKYVPNMFSSQASGNQAGSTSYSLRGISNTESIPTFDTPIGTYIDDFYISRQAFNNVLLYDVDHVEVLRGPQGTLFGRNTTGGAISIVTKKPTDEFYADAQAEFGSRDHEGGRVSVNVPLTDKLFIQASGFALSEDGWYKSRVTDTTVGDQHDYGARLAMKYLFSDTLQWVASADFVSVEGLAPSIPSYSNIQATAGKSATVFDAWRTLNTLYPTCSTGPNAFAWNANHCQDSISTAATLISNFKWDLDAVSVNFITGYRDSTENFSADFEGNTPIPGFANFILTNDGHFEEVSQEIKATGKLFDDRVNYTTGFYYFHEADNTQYAEGYGFVSGDILPNSNAYLRNTTDSYAVYAQADTKITDALTFTAGLRYTHDQKNVNINFTEFIPGFGTSYNTSQISTPSLSTWRATPKFALEYQVTDDVMAYFSATNGFKSGGWNARASSAVGFAPFFNETVWSYELGTRTEFFDRRLRVNADVFRADYNNLQISAVLQNVTPEVFATQNAGDSRVQGFELESHAVIIPGLTANFSLGAQDAKYTRITPQAALSGFSTSGPVILTPPLTITSGFSYDTFVEELKGNIRLTADIQYVRRFHSEPSVTDVTMTAYPVFASATYTTEDGQWAFELYCDNCLRHVYIQDPGGGNNSLGVLPFIGGRIKYHL
jgi:iron complex outermembrane receptor protein